jgi:hypothetical protein
LQSKGFKVEPAEGITDALKDALTVAEIAVRHEIKELREAAESQIRELRLEFKAGIAPLKWGMGLCAAGIVSLVIKAFFRSGLFASVTEEAPIGVFAAERVFITQQSIISVA